MRLSPSLAFLLLASLGPVPPLAAEHDQAAKVVRDQVKGSIFHDGGDDQLQRVTGQVRVVDANTIEFADGTQIDLNMITPDPKQMALVGDEFYPAGREAADYLRRLIDDKTVSSYRNVDNTGPWRSFVGDLDLKHAMVIGGWAIADHSSTQVMEFIAREQKRGLWRGRFIRPDLWQTGQRLPGEEEAARTIAAPTIQAQADPAASDDMPLLGTWETIDRHVAMGSLYQPVHGVRKREGLVRFERVQQQLRGYAVHADHEAISYQERWKDGYTGFRNVTFEKGRLSFEWDIAEWLPTAGPIAVERKRLENKGTVRIEAALQGERLEGTWKMYLADGTEVFRGEWEAWRALGVPDDSGPVILIGGRHQDLTAELRRTFFDLAGGKNAKIVIIPTAIATAEEQKTQQELRQPWLELGPQSVEILHTRDPKVADDPAFLKLLTEATAVFLTNGHQHRVFDAYRGTRFEQELLKVQARGGLVGGAGSGAAILGERVPGRPQDADLTERGFGLFFGLLLEEEASADFLAALAATQGYQGLILEPGAAVVIQGKKMQVLGTGKVEIHFAPTAGVKAKVVTLKPDVEHDLRKLPTGDKP
jgi:cyanophycinase